MAKGLGKGFDILIPTNLDKSIIEEDHHRVQKILISDVVPNKQQPRTEFDQQAMEELSSSVKRHGVLQPIIVVRHGDKYKIVAGERRWRAAKMADHSHIPAIVRSLEELEALELSLIENIQREDLTPMDQAMTIYRLQQQLNMAIEDIAAKLGKAPSTLGNVVRLLQLPEVAKLALNQGKISEGHARAILALRDQPANQEILLQEILKNKWTVRQAEQYVVALRKGAGRGVKKAMAAQTPFTKEFGKSLGTSVTLRRKAKGGEIVITYKNDSELKRLEKKLKS